MRDLTPRDATASAPLRFPDRQVFSTAAINCVLSQTYPASTTVWREALNLMSGLCGKDMVQREHDLIMGDPQALSLAKAAREGLDNHLRTAYPTVHERDQMLRGQDTLALPVAPSAHL